MGGLVVGLFVKQSTEFAAYVMLSMIAVLGAALGWASPCLAAVPHPEPHEVNLPPMGWNDWAHYRCDLIDSKVVLSNAEALVKSDLARAGYDTVVIDDCWMQKTRDSKGNLQPNVTRFPEGIEAVANAVHAMGLKFGIYEDAGYKTCAGYAGSGEPNGGGASHFDEDARLFESWGVDYLKLDACNVYVPEGTSKEAAYRKAYAAERSALDRAGSSLIFSESAPAYFQGEAQWYDVLNWVRHYGQLWREGSDIATFRRDAPARERFASVLWNYAYNLPLGRYQTPGNWDDPDFIIGGDGGMTLNETRSQMALWSMMSAPLILSSDITKLNASAVAILRNARVIGVDQDPLGRMATLVQRGPAVDVLFKPLSNGDDAVAVLNRSSSTVSVALLPHDLGFPGPDCYLDTEDLWSGNLERARFVLDAEIAPHDTEIWHVHPGSTCRQPTRTGTIVMTRNEDPNGPDNTIDTYTRCLNSSDDVRVCRGTQSEVWTVTSHGQLMSGDRCLDIVDGSPRLNACSGSPSQQWSYSLDGRLIGSDQECLTDSQSADGEEVVGMKACGQDGWHQVWSLPN
jgi:alpha-galactosidase